MLYTCLEILLLGWFIFTVIVVVLILLILSPIIIAFGSLLAFLYYIRDKYNNKCEKIEVYKSNI